jgi:hypothetical protein
MSTNLDSFPDFLIHLARPTLILALVILGLYVLVKILHESAGKALSSVLSEIKPPKGGLNRASFINLIGGLVLAFALIAFMLEEFFKFFVGLSGLLNSMADNNPTIAIIVLFFGVAVYFAICAAATCRER